jgi:hypothetical protein
MDFVLGPSYENPESTRVFLWKVEGILLWLPLSASSSSSKFICLLSVDWKVFNFFQGFIKIYSCCIFLRILDYLITAF